MSLFLSIETFISILILLLACSQSQWCEELQNSNGVTSQTALWNRMLLASNDGSSISFCPFIIDGDGCDLNLGIHIHWSAFLHCETFLTPNHSCIIDCPGTHFNISGTLSLDGHWVLMGATRGSILLYGSFLSYGTQWVK